MKLNTKQIEAKITYEGPNRTVAAIVTYLETTSYERLEHFGRSDYRPVTEYQLLCVEYLDDMTNEERVELDKLINEGPYE